MAWNTKRYNRINWRNRPSTATALGATNLNRIDVFCNEVDNYLIEIDAGKLNISTANGLLKSLAINEKTGIIVATQLDGTQYTWDLNLEKIPMSIHLYEDGRLVITTDDGSTMETNVAELIKMYVFNDSDTIGFSKEFRNDEYHVTAIVKDGSINEKHLDPDYRAWIQEYTNTAVTAANDSLQYSKDSKRWAVGDKNYLGSEIDNSKYYSEQSKLQYEKAKNEADRASQFANFVTPDFILMNNRLYINNDSTVEFLISDNRLYFKLPA